MSSASERYKSILDAALDAVICVDEVGRIVDWNLRAALMFGWHREDVTGQQVSARLLAGEDGNRLAMTMERYRTRSSDSAIGRRMAMQGRHQDGREFPVELTLSPIDVAGALHFALFIRDLSSRESEVKRRERQTLEAQLLQHATLLVAQAETFEDAIRNSLKVMCEMTGWQVGHAWIPDRRRARLYTKGIWHGIDEQRHKRFLAEMEDLSFAPGEGLPGEIWQRREAMWIRDITQSPDFLRKQLSRQFGVKGVFGFPVTAHDEVEAIIEFFSEEELTPEPQLLLFVGSISNELGRILERRRWDEERSRLAAIVDSSSDAIISKDFDGTIISWNDGAAAMYGYSADEAIGKTAAIILPPGMTEEEDEIRDAVRTGRPLLRFETRRRNKSGEQLDVSLTVSPIFDSRGRIVGSAAIERDITERKRRETELERAREDAVSALKAKNEFLANISHELRTPMNAIIGMIDLVLGEDLSPMTRDYLDTARDSSRVMLSLVNDLLDFSRIEAGKLELDVEPFSLRRTFDEAIRALSLRAYERGLELAGQVHSSVPDRLEGDGRRLRQVIMNLAGNAIKFTEQGEVTVSIAEDERVNGDVVLKLTVEDTGVGISAEDQQRIFAPFTQADASSTRKHTGTGLGLTICRELIERMGGRISVESQLGQGSRFTCTARFRVLADRSADLAPRVRQLKDLRVLIVDDNATNRRILSETLKEWSLEPAVATSASEAVEQIRVACNANKPFQLLIVDALMPEIDGFSLVETLEREGAGDSAVILMMSSADRQTFEDRIRDLDIDAFIEKPVSESVLMDAIMTTLGGPQTDTNAVQKIAAAPRAHRVLVVEDTPANQKVVRAILTKRGHDVTVAHNGRDAIEQHLRDDFDVILMDVQMPTMDGYQASRAIRDLDDERKAGVPIIAMTAHALPGDRVRCLQAGMDGYLSKPVDAHEMVFLVEQFASRRDSARPGAGPQTAASAGSAASRAAGTKDRKVISLEGARKRLGGDPELLRDMAEFLIQDAPPLLETVRVAEEERDWEGVRRAAHSLKGLAANFDAAAARELALRVEEAAVKENQDSVRNLAPQLEAAFADVMQALQQQALA